MRIKPVLTLGLQGVRGQRFQQIVHLCAKLAFRVHFPFAFSLAMNALNMGRSLTSEEFVFPVLSQESSNRNPTYKNQTLDIELMIQEQSAHCWDFGDEELQQGRASAQVCRVN